MIEYINISIKEYEDLSYEERKEKPYCIEYSNGDKQWRVNGKYHRENEPSILWYNGSEIWYINGKLHREDGPAVIYKDVFDALIHHENNKWYLNNIKYSFEKWCEILNKSDEEIIFLKLKYL